MTRKLAVGLVHNWPGRRNSEWDIIFRIRWLLAQMGHEALLLDPLGYSLDDNANRQAVEPVADGRCDLVLNLHYLNPKFLSGLSYVVNWNPIGYIVNDPITGVPVPREHLNYLMDCLRSHDSVLTAGSHLLDEYARAVRGGREGTYLPEAEITLHTTTMSSYPGDVISQPGQCIWLPKSAHYVKLYIMRGFTQPSTGSRQPSMPTISRCLHRHELGKALQRKRPASAP